MSGIRTKKKTLFWENAWSLNFLAVTWCFPEKIEFLFSKILISFISASNFGHQIKMHFRSDIGHWTWFNFDGRLGMRVWHSNPCLILWDLSRFLWFLQVTCFHLYLLARVFCKPASVAKEIMSFQKVLEKEWIFLVPQDFQT